MTVVYSVREGDIVCLDYCECYGYYLDTPTEYDGVVHTPELLIELAMKRERSTLVGSLSYLRGHMNSLTQHVDKLTEDYANCICDKEAAEVMYNIQKIFEYMAELVKIIAYVARDNYSKERNNG